MIAVLGSAIFCGFVTAWHDGVFAWGEEDVRVEFGVLV